MIKSGKQRLQELRELLGEPAYISDDILIYQGDCLELMRKCEPNTFDLTVTSPPYNIGKEYESERPLDDYIQWCVDWIAEIYRLSSEPGAFWLNLGYLSIPDRAKAIPIPYLIWDKVEFYLLQEVVWNYAAGVASKRSFSPRNEKFLWYVKDSNNYTFNLDEVRDPNVKYPNQKKNGKLRCNPLGKNPTDVWQFPKVTSGKKRSSPERTGHPAQFPMAVVDRIVKACSNPGDLILDPFMGSASLAETAVRNGRFAVGFEIDPKYIDMARTRLDYFYHCKSLNCISPIRTENIYDADKPTQDDSVVQTSLFSTCKV